MKLNIYENKKIIKTYEVDTYDLMYGTVTDIAAAIKIDELKTGSNDEIFKLALNLIMTSLDTVNRLLKDIFVGITDEELKKTKVKEIVKVLFGIVSYTYNEMMSGDDSKN